jgi:RNA polymerase sigma factor (sigma-70 family)
MNERRADSELLRAFARVGDQRALAEVIRRHLDLVYGTALRKVSDASAAEEISQNVFTALARKAWQFAPDDSLPAWLHKTALLESKSWLRSELRRRRREQTAAELGTTMNTPSEQTAYGALVPLLDEALLSLREKDRTALLLRYYECQSLREVGVSLGIEEDAAQKRVASALEKLAAFFQRRGFKTVTLATTAAALTQTAVAAPAPTAPRVTRAASKTAAPTFAGLLALLALLINLTRVQKLAVVAGLVGAAGLWLWMANQRGDEANAQFSAVETSLADISPSQNLTAEAPQIEASVLPLETVAEVPPRYVEITGEIEVVSYLGSEENGWTKAFDQVISFVCITGTNEWRVENDFAIGGESKWYYDGTNVYKSLRVTEPKSEDQRELHSKTRANFPFLAPSEAAASNATIYVWESPDGQPLGDPGVSLLWLAFCSGNYLKRDGRLVPLPDATADRFAYTDKIKTFEDEFGLPRTADLFLSRHLFRTSIETFEKQRMSGRGYQDYPQSVVTNLPDGALTFHYAVTESTNLLGWNLPTRFEYFQKPRRYVQNGDRFHRGTGKVASIRFAGKPGNFIVPSMQQMIVDWRFRHEGGKVNALHYTTTNASLSATNDAVLQERFEQRIARPKREP